MAVAEWQNGKVETWCPTQNPQAVQDAVAAALGMSPKDVTCHVTLLGGGFGRKSKPDYVVEAALLSKAAGKPVKVVWSREDDIRFDYYHSVAAMHMKGGLDKSGQDSSRGYSAARSRRSLPRSPPGAEYGADFETGMALNEMLFDVPNIRAENCPAKNHVRQGWMRAVCHLFHAFAVHSFVDELAHLNNSNYVDYFLKTIGPDRQRRPDQGWREGLEQWAVDGHVPARYRPASPRAGTVRGEIRLCASSATRRIAAIGIAAHRSFLSYVATAVEVAIDGQGNLTIPNVWTVADVGQVVMPDRVRSQFEGAAVFGTSLAMMGEITADARPDYAVEFPQLSGGADEAGAAGIFDVTIVESKAAARGCRRAGSSGNRAGDHRERSSMRPVSGFANCR